MNAWLCDDLHRFNRRLCIDGLQGEWGAGD